MKSPIVLNCEYSAAPGLEWQTTLEFRPLTRGYSIWASGYSAMEDAKKPARIDRVTKQLTWREVARWLRESQDHRLGGDLTGYIDVRGVSPWTAEILGQCWISEENPFPDGVPFLIELGDDELEYLWNWHSSFVSESAITALGELIEVVECFEPGGQSLKSLFGTQNVSGLPPAHQLLEVLSERCEGLQSARNDAFRLHNEAAVAVVLGYLWQCSLPPLTAQRPMQGLVINKFVSQCRAFVEFVGRETLKHGEVPQGNQNIPLTGEMSLVGIRPSEMTEIVTRDPVRVCHVLEWLPRCRCSVYPPIDVDLIVTWSKLPTKPIFTSRDDSSRQCKEVGWVQWLIKSDVSATLARIKSQAPHAIDALVNWALEIERELELTVDEPLRHKPGSGGAWGAAISSARREHEKSILNYCRKIINAAAE